MCPRLPEPSGLKGLINESWLIWNNRNFDTWHFYQYYIVDPHNEKIQGISFTKQI